MTSLTTRGHSIAGLLAVGGFPVAALLLSLSLGRTEAWSSAKKALLWIANLTWISVLLLVATLALMAMELTWATAATYLGARRNPCHPASPD